MTRISTIIFDFDGVILDSATVKLDAFGDVYCEEGEDMRRAVLDYASLNGGISRRVKFEYFERTLFSRPATPSSLDRLCALYGRLVDAQIATCRFIPGALDAIVQLAQTHTLHVVSGAPESDLRSVMDERNLTQYFSTITGAPTEKLAAFATILMLDAVAPGETLAIGDSLTEFEAAVSLEIPFLAVVSGTGEDRFPPDTPRIADLSDLPERVLGSEIAYAV